jgi:hypothetical protein
MQRNAHPGAAIENAAVNDGSDGDESDLASAFQKLVGRAATDEEKRQLYRVKEALDIRDTDAVWLIFMALQYHVSLYRAMPAEITNGCREVLANAEAASEAIVAKLKAAGAAQVSVLEAKTKELSAKAKGSHEETQRALTEAVREGVVASARDAARAEKWKWGGLSFLAAGIFCLVTVYFAKNMGRELGRAEGKREALNICQSWQEANAWIKTVEGHAAYNLALASAGNIQLLTTCNSPGWKIVDGQCCPAVNAKGSKCWRLTPQ